MTRHLRPTLIPAALLAVVSAVPASASDEESARASLKGIPAFRVVVEQFGSKVEKRDALKSDDLQAEVERQLVRAGVPVSKSAAAVLYANVAVVCGEDCAYTVTLEVQQRVRLERERSTSLPGPHLEHARHRPGGPPLPPDPPEPARPGGPVRRGLSCRQPVEMKRGAPPSESA